ncbi:MAG: heparinase II/III family protein, partial [Armatimonadota bacterium]
GQQTDELEVLFSEDFETASDADATLPDGWMHFTALHTSELSEEHAHGGRLSLKVTDNDPEVAVGLRSPHIDVTPGEYGQLRWWHYGTGGDTLSVLVEWWNAEGKRFESRSWGCEGTGEWVSHRKNFKVPDGTATLTVHVNSWTGNVGTGYIDDITVLRGLASMWDRTPQPPADVDHPCGLYRPGDIERAKRNIDRHPWARGVLQGWRSSAKFWVELPDDELSYWIPDKTPFSKAACPVCGANTFMAWGNETDRLQCRSCGFTWPNPDYPEDVVKTYIDPMGEPQEITYYEGKEWLNHGTRPTTLYCFSGLLRDKRLKKLRSLGSVGKAYAFTGEMKYAKTVRRVLLRLAEVYPHYIAHDWFRYYEDYGDLQSGKLHGWKLTDATIFTELATAYDLTYNSGVYSRDDKVTIEEGCFREFKRLMTATSPRGTCVNDGPFAMGAGAVVGLILGDHEFISWAIEPPEGYIGFIEKYFTREGHWAEASPAYESMALNQIHLAPEALRGYSDPPSYTADDRYDNLDLFDHPLMEKMLVAGAKDVMPDGYLPATNDSTFGTAYPSRRAETNYFWYPTQRNKRLMAWAFGGSVGEYGDEYALFRRDPDLDFSGVEPWNPSEESVVQPGVGWAILRTGSSKSDAAAFIDFGPKGSGHGHADRLNIAYWDFGKEMVTDLGYLGWPHPNRPWMITDMAHNTVIVDGRHQGTAGGEILAYAGQGAVQGIIASAPDVYEETEKYRRNLVFVDHGLGKRYLVDLFEVAGGSEHQYVFHADGETFTAPDLDYAELDGSTLGEEDAGYGWLRETKQATTDDDIACEWITDEEEHFGTRLRMMGQPGTRLVRTKSLGLRNRSTPYAERDLHIAMARRQGPENAFMSVVDVFKGQPRIGEVTRLNAVADRGSAWAVQVKCGDLKDIVIFADESAAGGEVRIEEYPDVRFSGRMGVVSLLGDKPVRLWMLGGSQLECGSARVVSTPRYTGTITAIDAEGFAVEVDCPELPPGGSWSGQQMLVKGHSDGAYVMDRISREEGVTRIHLADEPIFTCEVGDEFTIMPLASVEMLRDGMWRVRGNDCSLVLDDSKSGPHTYTRLPGERWSAVERRDGTALSSRPGGERWVWAATEPIDRQDATPPVLTEVCIDERRLRPGEDAGYVPDPERIVFTFVERKHLLTEGVHAKLTGQRAGDIPLRVHVWESETGEDRVRVALRPDAHMPADEYTVEVEVSDAVANRAEYSL